MNGFRFRGLDPHIRDVDDHVIAPMRRAAAAGRPLDHLAYGLVGQAFAVTVTVAADGASRAVRGLCDEAVGVRAGLVAAQETYRRAERDNAALLAGAPLTGTPLTGTPR